MYIVLPKIKKKKNMNSTSVLHFLAIEVEGFLSRMLTCNDNTMSSLRIKLFAFFKTHQIDQRHRIPNNKKAYSQLSIIRLLLENTGISMRFSQHCSIFSLSYAFFRLISVISRNISKCV